jgi:hypothetical protein
MLPFISKKMLVTTRIIACNTDYNRKQRVCRAMDKDGFVIRFKYTLAPSIYENQTYLSSYYFEEDSL